MSVPSDHLSPAEAPTIDASGDAGHGERTDRRLDHGLDGLQTEPVSAGDSFDQILKQVIRSGQRADPLGTGTQLGSRFTINGVLGEGGMGTVYVAHDASLGRDVAIKVHHAAGGGRRLRREAVAMAKLAHPHVVTVFEVGELAGRPFVVMEYVPGTTLRAWLAAAPRSVREILAVVAAAGEGLAAAHDAGLVHRDVKPENVLIGADGRARVGDFGLARGLDSSEDLPPPLSSSQEMLLAPVTQTGAVLGTPAYMSPEQFAGAPVDARADQFAYCVTVWEALWNERPFAGTTYAQLHAAIALGTRKSPPATPKVPARVRLALERGLSTDSAARFPSMHALLAAMRPTRGRRWGWIAGGAALGVAAVGAVAWAAMSGSEAPVALPSCDTAGAADLASVRSDLPDTLRRGGHSQLAGQAEAAQAKFTASYRKDAKLACEASRANGWSPEVVATSRECFAITARSAAVSLATVDPAKPMDIVRHLRRLPSADLCRNPTYLASRPPLPGDPAKLDQLIEANTSVHAGFDAVDVHDLDRLRQIIAKLDASPARTDPTVAAGLGILRGWLTFDAGKADDARKLFIDAYYAGRAIDDDQISARALSVLITRGASLGLSDAQIEQWTRTALADADRVRTRSPELAGRVYTIAAGASDLGGNADQALMFVARARSVLDHSDPKWIETYSIEGAVLMWSGHVDDGVKAYDSALAQTIAYYGADDPEVGELLSNYAVSLQEAGRNPAALEIAQRADKLLHRVIDPSDDRLDSLRVNLAAVLIDSNDKPALDEAQALLETARANDAKRFGETNIVIANIDSNLASISNIRGDYDQSIRYLDRALATDEKLLGPDHVDVADILYNLAAAQRIKHDYPHAIASAERAAKIYGQRGPGSDRHRSSLIMSGCAANDAHDFAKALAITDTVLAFDKPPQSPEILAWAQLEHGRALIGVGRGTEARSPLESAKQSYTNLRMTQRVEQIDALLATISGKRPR